MTKTLTFVCVNDRAFYLEEKLIKIPNDESMYSMLVFEGDSLIKDKTLFLGCDLESALISFRKITFFELTKVSHMILTGREVI